jgi:hypothetical protein
MMSISIHEYIANAETTSVIFAPVCAAVCQLHWWMASAGGWAVLHIYRLGGKTPCFQQR